MKGVMYHYVTEFDERFPNLRFLDFKNFLKQLDYFEEKYGFVTFKEWEEYIFNGITPNKIGKVLLTFDDALSCHFNYVFKELKRRNLWGLFYIPTNPYKVEKMLYVHKIQILSSVVSGLDLNLYTKKIISQNMIPDEKKIEFRNDTYKKQNNYSGITEFKRLLNYFLDYDYREEIIEKISNEFSVKFNINKFYLSIPQIREMENSGMIIGSHTASHPVMSKLDSFEQRKEIKSSFSFLNSICKLNHKTYCHPFGGFHSFDEHTLSILEENKVDYSFNVQSANIDKVDWVDNKHSLPRFDCNEFQFGGAN
tara:strand:+ start:225 stop:1151 length:927 start_codon:yes stop_codon:yes gene_type:complete